MTLPEQLNFQEAAILCDGPLTSLHFLRNLGQVQPGQTILINGASGSLDTAAVQLAKYFGAYIIGVCSAKNKALVQSLGANEVIDYQITDFTKLDRRFDFVYPYLCVFDASATTTVASSPKTKKSFGLLNLKMQEYSRHLQE